MSHLTRRQFLGNSAAATTAATLVAGLGSALHVAHGQEKEDADRKDRAPVRLAIMGVNGRGKALLSGFAHFPEVEIAYICDPDLTVIPAAVAAAEKLGKKTPQVESDFRKALDDKSVTALVCAAPDHWHSLATIWACQAGKDVYVEKPVSHNPVEGRRMVEAARKYNRIVQAGTQRRSNPTLKEAVEYVRSGKLGDVNFCRTWISSQRPNIGHESVTSPPPQLDFDLWCGPAPNNGYKKNLVHYHWHWRWDYGTGECGNNGIHALDVARWGMGIEYPETVTCGGNKYFFDDDQETPDTQIATFDFPTGCISWEHRTWSPRGIDGEGFGVEFYGSEGTMYTGGTDFIVYAWAGKKEKVIEKKEGTDPVRAHLQNFLDCLVTREKPNAEIEIGHRSTQFCHLANIAWRTRSTVKFDGETETISGNPAASKLLGREYRKGFELPKIG
jgi:predicted dehydrogenase